MRQPCQLARNSGQLAIELYTHDCLSYLVTVDERRLSGREPMQFARVKLDPNKDKPKLEIIIGKRQLGEYRVFQFVPGPPRRSKVVGAGDNVQQDAHDVFLLDVPQTLDGSDIIITAVVFKQTQDPNDLYAVTAALTQNGEPVVPICSWATKALQSGRSGGQCSTRRS